MAASKKKTQFFRKDFIILSILHFMPIGEVFKLRLLEIAPGGDALGRLEGKPVFVEGGAPCETVCCRIVQEHNTWARAELLEVVEPSCARINSVCAFYGKCGGCNLQHIDYETQLAAKADILKDSLVRIGGLQPPELVIFPSPPWEYRNRMQFHCLRQRAKSALTKQYGLKGRSGGEIIEINDCPVAAEGIRKLLKTEKGTGGKENEITLPVEKDRFTVFCKDEILLSEGGLQKGSIKLLEKEILLDAGVFFQSNCFMLEKLIAQLRVTAKSADQNLPMADLYCGVGTFAFYLKDMFPKIILAEENKTAVSLARENLRGAQAEFFAVRDTDWSSVLFRRKDSFGFAVVDPPRAGLAPKLAAALAREGPPVLVYISCDAASLARDCKILINGGYALKTLNFFDFYPQTAHIESMAVFEK
jgi:23S rRNA (uracil1939-C5)-methyltransferase